MLKIALSAYLVAYGVAVGWGLMRGKDIELLPSMSWLLLMLLPFWVQFDVFPESARSIQALGIALLGAALLAGDLLELPAGGAPAEGRRAGWGARLHDFRLYAFLLVVIGVYHLSLLDYIPVAEKYLHRVEDARELSLMREQTSKLLDVNALVKYLFTWAVNIVAPLAVLLAWRQKRLLWAAVILGVAFLYAVMSLAKVPSVLLAAILAVAFLQGLAFSTRLKIYGVAALLALPVAWHAYTFLHHHPASVLNYRAAPETVAQLQLAPGDPRAALTVGDHSRLRPTEVDKTFGRLERLHDYLAYRVFFAPADVSSRWYQYFPAVSGRHIGLQGLTPGDREHSSETHPARLVAAWAYGARFPDRYLDTAHAYASVDADAYARFGVAGVIAAAIAVLALRLLMKRLRTPSALADALYAVALTLCALLWPMASLQAALVANGLGVAVALMLALALLARRHALP